MFSESSANKIERYGIGAGINVAKTKSHYSQKVPKRVVVVLSMFIKVEKQQERIEWCKTYRKDSYKNQHCDCYFLPRFNLKGKNTRWLKWQSYFPKLWKIKPASLLIYKKRSYFSFIPNFNKLPCLLVGAPVICSSYAKF